MKNGTLVILLFFLIATSGYSQEIWSEVRGKVIDAHTRLPLPFASIRVHRKNTGTLSNENGDFIFKITSAQLSDSLEISFVGYQPGYFKIPSLNRNFNTLALEPAVQLLGEVTISDKSGLDIVKEFIARIPENYDTTSKHLQAFYREAINLGKDSIAYSESVLDIYKSSYIKDADKDQLVLLKGRRSHIKWKPDPFYGFIGNLSNGARGSLLEDMVKSLRTVNAPVNPANFKYYQFTLEKTIDQGSKSLYVISYEPVKKTPRWRQTLHGLLYINSRTMALERMTISLPASGIRYMNNHRGFGYTIGSVAYQMSLHWTDLREVITWSELGGKYYLKEVQRDFSASVTSRKRNLIDTKWNAKSLFAVTTVVPGIAPVVKATDDIMNKTTPISALMGGKDNDKAFWENYNIVQPAYVDTVASTVTKSDSVAKPSPRASNRQNGFTRADTLHGKLTLLRSCYDVTFYHLDVALNPEIKFIEGTSLIRFDVVQPFTKMQIDLYENMEIKKIVWREKELFFTREFGAVFIQFPFEQKRGTSQELKVYYSGHPQEPNLSIPMNGGFLWNKDKNGKPWFQVVCQGSGASLWWPCKDHLSDEPDSARITVTVPKGLTDISNGVLRSTTELSGNRTRFDWYVSYPINNYNITLNVGDYLKTTDTYNSVSGPLGLHYYFIKGSEEKAKMVFAHVKPMLALYEKKFGTYPFPRDGFTLMESLYPMEHQGAVSIGKMVPEKTDSLELNEIVRLMDHEAAHEWWGNSVSIKDFADFWIHEAFATYAEALMIESEYGYEASADYINNVKINNTETVVGEYGVNHIFYDLNDIYNKGCLMINTLRHVINNDVVWFDVLRSIQREFRYKTVTTSEIETYISQKTKTDLRYFFEQYLRRLKPPRLIINTTQQGNATILNYKWEADVNDFRMPVVVSIGKDKFGFIYPTTSWKTITLHNLLTEDFEVKENDFYMEIVRD